ncbi:MAG: Uncharacterised protein [Flavobacteriia bacterium]|nr:MAG: Uncharacterised protein [Flavobacteriia bacterium]
MKEILPLLLIEFCLDLGLDLVLHLQHLQFVVEMLQHGIGPLDQIVLLEQLLLARNVQIHIGGNEIDQKCGALDILYCDRGLCWNIRRLFDDVQGHILDRIDEGLEWSGAALGFLLLQSVDRSAQIGLSADDLFDAETLLALEDDRCVSIGHFEHAQDLGQCAHRIETFRIWVFILRTALCKYTHQVIGFLCVVQELDRFVPTRSDGDHHTWKEYGIPERQNGQNVREILLIHLFLIVRGHQWNEFRVLRVAL